MKHILATLILTGIAAIALSLVGLAAWIWSQVL